MIDRLLPDKADVLAPDGSEVRILAATEQGSMAHFKLKPGQISMAIAHHTVTEIWFVVAGLGRLWRKSADVETVVELVPGLSLTIVTGSHFQFRCYGDSALEIVGVTMPPWPGADEAYAVKGQW